MKQFILKYKWWILGAIILIILIIVARRQGWFGKKISASSKVSGNWTKVPTSSVPSYSGTSTSSKCSQNADFPLKKGSVGKQVGALQRYINYIRKQKGKTTISEDCDFGPATESAVLEGIGQDYVSLGNYIGYNITAFE